MKQGLEARLIVMAIVARSFCGALHRHFLGGFRKLTTGSLRTAN